MTGVDILLIFIIAMGAFLFTATINDLEERIKKLESKIGERKR